jgi:hypothetical protein
MSTTRRSLTRVSLALGMVALAAVAEAGPPLICHPFDAGKAPLLPWNTAGSGWNQPDRSYDVRNLTADTLRLLTPDAPILARMENLRRATIYASRDRQVANELLVSVMNRALAESASGSRNSLALFDAGYLIESYRQAAAIDEMSALAIGDRTAFTKRGAPRTVDGYAFVRKALDGAGSNPEMEYAASLMNEGPSAAEHLRRAKAGAAAGSLLARNIEK